MEVDPPPPSSTPGPSVSENLGLNPLKRSNSAPMLATTASQIPNRTCNSPVLSFSVMHSHSFSGHSFPRQFERIRRYSTSSTGLFSPTTPQKTPSRLAQIINEERRNVKEREEAHERETHTNMQIYASCEELSLSDPSDQEPMVTDLMHRRPKSFQEPLHIFTSPLPYASSPSPTRIRKQCFSPSLGQPVRTLAGIMTPSPSPSPTRKSFARRSISPINMQPSRNFLKRKINMESEVYDSSTPQKRFHLAPHTCISPGGGAGTSTPERFSSMPHPLLQSVSSSSLLSDTGSPEQQVPTAMDGSSSHHLLHHPVAQSAAHTQHPAHHHHQATTGPPSILSQTPQQQQQPSPMAFPLSSSRLSSENHLHNNHHQPQSIGSGFGGFTAFHHNMQDSVETSLSTSLSSSMSGPGTESENSDMAESGLGSSSSDMMESSVNTSSNNIVVMSHSGLTAGGGNTRLSGVGDLGGGGDFGMLSARFQQQQKQSCKPTHL